MDQIRKLLHAAEQGNECIASELLDNGVHVDNPDEEGVTALHTAAANGHENMVRLLLSKGASFDVKNCYGWTPLMTAACYGHFKIVAILIQYKADIFAQNDLGATALDSAARSGHYQIVQLLIEASSEWPYLSDNCVTALLNACHHGHEHVVKLLLDKRTDVNHKDSVTGWTPLMFASLNGHISVVQALCEYGADTNATNILHQTALEIAGKRQRTEVEAYLDRKTTIRPQVTGPKALRLSITEAAKNGNVQVVRELLESGEYEVNAKDEDGATPLMFAAMCGHLQVAQLLLDKGADIDSQDEISGWTALMQATYYSHKNIVKLLLDRSANVRVQAEEGYTAFDMATIIGDTDIVRLLASITMQLPGNQRNGNSRLFSISNNISTNELMETQSKEISSQEVDLKDMGKSGLKTWWSKMSSRLKNLTLIRTIRVSSVSFGEENKNSVVKDFTSDSSTSCDEMQGSDSAKSLVSVVDSALKAGGHYSKRSKTLPLGSPVSRLPDDVISPVVPPSMPSPTFELTQVKADHGDVDLEDEAAPHVSSVSGYSAYHSNMTGFSGSPDSSFSTGSHFTSVSNTLGNRTLRAASSPSDIPGKTLVASHHKPARRTVHSPTPTLISVKSAASAPGRLHPSHKIHKSSKHMSGSRSDDGITCGTYSRITENSEKDDEVADILKKLSLEKYNSMFEEQEVDMEAFLTLNEVDLKDLGVTQRDARQQILSAIKELNVGKVKERQQFKESISESSRNKSQLSSGYGSASPSSTNVTRWAQTIKMPHPSY